MKHLIQQMLKDRSGGEQEDKLMVSPYPSIVNNLYLAYNKFSTKFSMEIGLSGEDNLIWAPRSINHI